MIRQIRCDRCNGDFRAGGTSEVEVLSRPMAPGSVGFTMEGPIHLCAPCWLEFKTGIARAMMEGRCPLYVSLKAEDHTDRARAEDAIQEQAPVGFKIAELIRIKNPDDFGYIWKARLEPIVRVVQ